MAASLNSVGITYDRLGRYEEALEFMLRALRMREVVYEGADHTYVAAMLSNVGE